MSFEKSIGAILHHEGGYCNHKEDAGGETYKGIARRSWPNWQGWETIDSAKTQLNPGSTRKSWATFTEFIETNYPHIQAAVEAFYRVTFWETMKCDYFSDAVGHLLFDFSVNSGNSRATKHLQKALLALGAKIEVDGKLGEQTINETGMYEPAIILNYLGKTIYLASAQQPLVEHLSIDALVYLCNYLMYHFLISLLICS